MIKSKRKLKTKNQSEFLPFIGLAERNLHEQITPDSTHHTGTQPPQPAEKAPAGS